ncbi:MAG: HAMP domain-containing histidine kinase [Lachnospiraceae bacterium]|nr:HAMP domain-containing histidine kinase [Lachnospiraceae bacterium]
MDWLEEKVEEMKKYLQNKGLVRALVWYLCISMTGVLAACWITGNLCSVWMEVLQKRQIETGMGEYFDDTHILEISVRGGSGEEMLYWFLAKFNQYCLYLYLLIAFVLAGKFFLETKIKQPIAVITQGLNYINMGDYSHEIIWRSKDEMGMLCEEMEQMRRNMLENKRDQWKQQEEQRKINAAFAHDIRTPLTVIRGYTEFLQKYVPEGRVSEKMLLEKLNTIQEQQERLLHFSNTMTTIQNMEEWELLGDWHSTRELIEKVEAVVDGIRQNTHHEITLQAELPEQEIFFDQNLFMEVFENLLSNAARYAVHTIQIKLTLKEREIRIFVKDDGPGFSEKALCRGMEVYFSEEENSKEHFGIGLSICRMLCENHGGSLALRNSIDQGAIAAAGLVVGIQKGLERT